MKYLDSLKNENWDWALFGSIALYFIVPSIYQSYNIYLIGNSIPGENSLSIVSQWQFVQVFFEVVQEALVFPLFYFVGSRIKSEPRLILERVKASLMLLFMTLVPIILSLSLGVEYFVDAIDTNKTIVSETQSYLGIKIWSLLFSISNMGLVIIIESLKRNRILVFLVVVKLVLFASLDSFFFGGYSFSLGMGIRGVAWSSLIAEFLISCFLIFTLLKSFNVNLKVFFAIPNFKDLRLFNRISLGIGIESLVKNVAYFVMILKMLNMIGAKEIGGYYLAMHLFWSFFLIPTFVIGETSKVLIANESNDLKKVKQILFTGLILALLFNLIGACLIPFRGNILQFFSADPILVEFGQKAVLLLIIPYILLSLNMIVDSIFYGLGKTKYLAFQSLWTNGTVYLSAYLFYLSGFWQPDFTSILLIFGLGMLVDSFFTIFYARKVLNKD